MIKTFMNKTSKMANSWLAPKFTTIHKHEQIVKWDNSLTALKTKPAAQTKICHVQSYCVSTFSQ